MFGVLGTHMAIYYLVLRFENDAASITFCWGLSKTPISVEVLVEHCN